MKTPLIVLTPQNMPMEAPFQRAYNYSNGFNTSAIVKRGGVPVITTFLDEEKAMELMKKADGLMMTGGADIDPTLYGEEVMDCCGTIEYDRDKSDIALLKAALALKKPILCICRGCQLANVYFGGTMYQDLPTQAPSDVKHSNYTHPDYMEENTHNIKVVEGSPLHQLVGDTEFGINSLHHQAIKDMGKGVIPMAWSTDGILESWYLDSDDQWLRAYQWHPEMQIESVRSKKIFDDFMSVCKENMK
ncbi:MAG: gamma-glutamyl-gamma-aminobutyrate hydrolase family protein [Oscillospiraceae bacterium]|nr:gamma-glutamyl-gamma-aminobutyrate hydrolase family protein [Oscillospiraceae bacterium]